MTPATEAMAAYIAPVINGIEVDAPILRQVPLPFLAQMWPAVSSWIEGVVTRSAGRWSVDTVARHLLEEQWQLWVVWDNGIAAVLATEIYSEDTGIKLARIVFATGRDARRWSGLISEIEEWARDQGAVKLEMMARKGWARHLPEYKMTHVLLEKDLRDGQ